MQFFFNVQKEKCELRKNNVIQIFSLHNLTYPRVDRRDSTNSNVENTTMTINPLQARKLDLEKGTWHKWHDCILKKRYNFTHSSDALNLFVYYKSDSTEYRYSTQDAVAFQDSGRYTTSRAVRTAQGCREKHHHAQVFLHKYWNTSSRIFETF